MSELISGEDALKYLGSGRTIGFKKDFKSQLCWVDKQDNYLHISDFFNGEFQFFLKPKMIEVNGIEMEPPKKIDTDPVTGAVGLIYGDIEKMNQAKKALEIIFKGENNE